MAQRHCTPSSLMVRRRVAPSRTMLPAAHPSRRARCALLRMRSEYVLMRSEYPVLHHHAQPFRSPRDTGVQPPGAAVLEGEAFVEQNHVIPLRTLRFVHGQHVAIVELVIGLALLPRDRLDAA